MVMTLFLSPSFLYLCRFLWIFVRKNFCPGLARSGLVMSYARTEVWVNRVQSRSFTLAFSEEYLFVSVSVFFFRQFVRASHFSF